MNESTLLLVICLAALTNSSPLIKFFGTPAIEIEGAFDQSTGIKDAQGLVVVQSGPVSMTAGRDSAGSLVGGLGVYKTGYIPLGNFGKLSVKTTANVHGLFNAVVDTEIFTGPRSFNPLTLSVTRQAKGYDFIASTDLGYVGGTFATSTESDVISKFEIHLNMNGWITAVAKGKIKNKKIQMMSYNFGFDAGASSGAVNLDGDFKVLNYEKGASVGLFHYSGITDLTNNKSETVKVGISLGVVDFEIVINSDKTVLYSAELDTGIVRFNFNHNKDSTANWKGSLDLANIGIDCEQTIDGLYVFGGRIQLGVSVINIHRDSTGHFTVKWNEGSVIE